MTIVKKEVTREEARKKVVQTCDVCGLSEMEMPDNESIDTIGGDKSRNLKWEIDVGKLSDGATIEEEWTEEFQEYTEAQEYLTELDMDEHTVTKRTYIETDWELYIDACENCQKMLFGGTIGRFGSQKVV